MFVAGYGSDLATASSQFSALQDALLARDPHTAFVQFSYVGSSIRGCSSVPAPYSASDTAQSISASTRTFVDTLQSLQASCTERIGVVGHSLGGLIAFLGLGQQPTARVYDAITVDSPLGGAPAGASNLCIDAGFCAAGPVADDLASLYSHWDATAADNQSREQRITAGGTRLSAWGNQSDCLYYVPLCTTVVSVSLEDARETQWLGISRAVHRDYPFAAHLWNIPASHLAVLENAAADLAADLLP
jgi:pimeloyl-ACP methyl ester carboxylesterase